MTVYVEYNGIAAQESVRDKLHSTMLCVIIGRRGVDMQYMTVHECAVKWKMSDRTVRNYCLKGALSDVIQVGKHYYIPETAEKPMHKNTKPQLAIPLAEVLYTELQQRNSNGACRMLQTSVAYNYGSVGTYTLEQVQQMYTAYVSADSVNKIDHKVCMLFRCVDYVVCKSKLRLNVQMLDHLYAMLAENTDAVKHKPHKQLTAEKCNVSELQAYLQEYNRVKKKTLVDIIDLQYKLKKVYTIDADTTLIFLVMLKECLRCNICTFVLERTERMKYVQVLNDDSEQQAVEVLCEICMKAQNLFAAQLKALGVDVRMQ